jgi:hypothetical protein
MKMNFALPDESTPKDVLAFQEYATKHGHTGGWESEYHVRFLNVWKKSSVSS